MKKLDEFISENSPEIFVTGGISREDMTCLEESLGLHFCAGMSDFLASYGILMGYGVEILGCGKNGNSMMKNETLRFREFGLEENYLVIRNVDEWIYCLNNFDGSVSSWDRGSKKHILCASDFEEYIVKELEEAKEDWD